MLDRNLFQISIVDNTATISFSVLGGRGTVMWLADLSPTLAGYVSHQIVETESEPRFELVLSGEDINNIVDQAFVTLS
jgi:hypothetical protein